MQGNKGVGSNGLFPGWRQRLPWANLSSPFVYAILPPIPGKNFVNDDCAIRRTWYFRHMAQSKGHLALIIHRFSCKRMNLSFQWHLNSRRWSRIRNSSGMTGSKSLPERRYVNPSGQNVFLICVIWATGTFILSTFLRPNSYLYRNRNAGIRVHLSQEH